VELYLVRHAEAAGPDGQDPGLSDKGRAQAVALGERLSCAGVATLLHSPRRRALETAAIVSEALPDVSPMTSDLLNDRTPVPSRARRHDYPRKYWRWLEATPTDEKDEDGATLSNAFSELEEIARRRLGAGPLALVTHAFVIGWFVRSVLDAPTWRWLGLDSANTGLSIVRFTADGAFLTAFNDTGHLARSIS
jgi:serine/threonine-protein phosphatase PGAM5